jgi:hypothetical protein
VLETKLEPHVDDRDDDPAQVDYAFDEFRPIRDSADGIASADLLDLEDADSILRVAESKAQELAGRRFVRGGSFGRGRFLLACSQLTHRAANEIAFACQNARRFADTQFLCRHISLDP